MNKIMVKILNNEDIGLHKSGVYFLKNNLNNTVKIGCSRDIQDRLKMLYSTFKHIGQTNIDLDLVNYILCDDYQKLESDLHKLFKKSNVVNEWYSVSKDEIDKAVDNINLDNYISNKKQGFDFKNTALFAFKDNKFKFRIYGNIETFIDNRGMYFITTNVLTKIHGGMNWDALCHVCNVLMKDNKIGYEEFIFIGEETFISVDFIFLFMSVCIEKQNIFTKNGFHEFFVAPMTEELKKYIHDEKFFNDLLYDYNTMRQDSFY